MNSPAFSSGPQHRLQTTLLLALAVAGVVPSLPSIPLCAQVPAGEPAAAAPAPRGKAAAAARAGKTPPPNVVVLSIPDTVEVIRDIAYRDGNELWKLDIARLKQPAGRPQPVLLFIHGGGWSGGDKRFGYAGIQGAVDFAQKGYVGVAVNYRLAGKAPFPAAVEDVRAAVRWVRAHATRYNIDPDRIGAYGNSSGAHLALMLALPDGHEPAFDHDGPHAEHSAKIQAVCTSASPTNFVTMRGRNPSGDTTLPEGFGPGRRGGVDNGFLAGPPETDEIRARAASPVTYVTSDDPPVLLIHGTRDGVFATSQPEELLAKLRGANVGYAKLLMVDGAGHAVFVQDRELTIPAMESFFARTLATPKAK